MLNRSQESRYTLNVCSAFPADSPDADSFAPKVFEISTDAWMQMQEEPFIRQQTPCLLQDAVSAGDAHRFTGAELDFHHVCQQSR